MSIATLFVLVIFLFSLLLLKRALTLQLLLLLGVFFPLREFITMWNTRMASSINSVSPPKEFCLDSRMYNISGKVRDRCMGEKNRGKNGAL